MSRCAPATGVTQLQGRKAVASELLVDALPVSVRQRVTLLQLWWLRVWHRRRVCVQRAWWRP
jgi:hypothetical protein